MLAWHFIHETRQLRTGEVVEADRTYTAHGPLELCCNGMHACRRALDALTYALGPVVCRVRLHGEIIQRSDKAVARSRQVLWLADATRLIHEFALSVATDALCLADTTDARSWKVLDVKARWLRGEATDQELTAARAAAWDAFRDVSEDAAKSAAWAASRAADRASAWAAARDAAWAAVWDEAARAAAWASAWDAYSFQLETMLESLAREEGKA